MGTKTQTGIIMGVANQRSIATGIATQLHAQGARMGFSYLPDESGKMRQRVEKAIEGIPPLFIEPCNVGADSDIKTFFDTAKSHSSHIDFLLHSIAFAPLEDIRCPTVEASRKGFLTALDVSVYSFIATAKHAAALMPEGGSLLTLSYFGGEKVVAGYKLMVVAKAPLEAAVRYLAYDLGPKNIRVNAISAGPIKTLAASAVGDFGQMLGTNAAIAPLPRNVTLEEIGNAASFLLSPTSSGITGEVVHVDGGYHIMGSPGRAFCSPEK
jgi:enoyl-[acyl-carrier protein] reductase I